MYSGTGNYEDVSICFLGIVFGFLVSIFNQLSISQ